MNIFENYLSKINKIILNNKKLLRISILDSLDNINLEVPPDHFNYDLSTNVSLVLAKSNKLNPSNLAKDIKKLLLENINDFEKIDIAGPGFLNIKLSKDGFVININNKLDKYDSIIPCGISNRGVTNLKTIVDQNYDELENKLIENFLINLKS